MSRPFIQLWPILFVLAAGCKTDPKSVIFRPRVPDWEAEDVAITPHKKPSASIPAAASQSPGTAETRISHSQPAMSDTEHSSSKRAEEPVPRETWVPLLRWSKVSGLPMPSRSCSQDGMATFAISSTNGVFGLTAGSKIAHWEGTELRLGFAPVLIDNQPYVHRLDLLKTVQPLLNRDPSQSRVHSAEGPPRVVIDPGHGGQNSGARSIASQHYEKDYTLDWARRLQALLIERGWNALLTRSNDFDLALSNRVAFADQHQADLFVSLHFNSAFPDSSQSGLETYCLTPAGMPSTVTRGFGDEPSQSFPNNAFDAQNLLLAVLIHEGLVPASGNHDRGVRHARFLGVLRNQHCPAILIEGGYLSNPKEARQIDNPAFRQKLAEAIASALGGKPNMGTAQAAPAPPKVRDRELESPN